jgi:hypothetical protein
MGRRVRRVPGRRRRSAVSTPCRRFSLQGLERGARGFCVMCCAQAGKRLLVVFTCGGSRRHVARVVAGWAGFSGLGFSWAVWEGSASRALAAGWSFRVFGEEGRRGVGGGRVRRGRVGFGGKRRDFCWFAGARADEDQRLAAAAGSTGSRRTGATTSSRRRRPGLFQVVRRCGSHLPRSSAGVCCGLCGRVTDVGASLSPWRQSGYRDASRSARRRTLGRASEVQWPLAHGNGHLLIQNGADIQDRSGGRIQLEDQPRSGSGGRRRPA